MPPGNFNPYKIGIELFRDINEEYGDGGPVELSIYSVTGRLVKTLLKDVREPGTYRMAWDGRDEGGQTVGTGVYYATFASPQGRFTRTLVHLR